MKPGERETNDPILKIKVKNHYGVYVDIYESAPETDQSNPQWDTIMLSLQSVEQISKQINLPESESDTLHGKAIKIFRGRSSRGRFILSVTNENHENMRAVGGLSAAAGRDGK